MASVRILGRFHDAWDSDVAHSFRNSPITIVAAIALAICLIAAGFAPWLAPHNPFDLKTLNLLDALTPPAWIQGGKSMFPLGTDDQGRDLLSAIMFGSRVSLVVGLVSVFFAMLIGVSLGLLAGYAGGKTEAFIMRVAEVHRAVGQAAGARELDVIGAQHFQHFGADQPHHQRHHEERERD